MSAFVLTDDKSKVSIVVGFETAQYSERYQVSVMNNGVLYSKNVSKVITPVTAPFYSIGDDSRNSCGCFSFMKQTGKQNVAECDAGV